MPLQRVIIHERLANWARQLRPRFPGWPIRWSETRSTASLVQETRRSAYPILVIDLDKRPVRGLEDLDAALQEAPSALSLVLDPHRLPDVAALAREIGATLVLSGMVVPPVVEALIHRWLPLARDRAEADGWSSRIEDEPEPWDSADAR